MDEVAALVGDVLVELAVFLDRFLIITGAGFHAAEVFLDLRQLFLGLLQPPGRVRHGSVVRHVEMAHGIFQTYGGFRCWSDGIRHFYLLFVQNVAVIFAALRLFHGDSLQLPPRLRTAGKLRLDNPRLGHADAVLCGVDGGAGLKLVITGGEGVFVGLFPLEPGMAEAIGVFKKHPKSLGEPVVFLDERLIVHLGQERRGLFVLGRGGDEVLVGFQVKPLLVGQHPVPDVPAAAKGLFKQLRLGLRGAEPDLEGGILDNPAILCALCARSARHPAPSLL